MPVKCSYKTINNVIDLFTFNLDLVVEIRRFCGVFLSYHINIDPIESFKCCQQIFYFHEYSLKHSRFPPAK